MLRDALREHTRAQHARLEQRLAIERRVRDRDAYVELLRRFLGFYVPVEARVVAFAQAFRDNGIDLAERLKVAKLQRDLIVLGENASNHADSIFIPAIPTFPRAVGCFYVMEGSTLGAQVIMRCVRESLGFEAEHGAAFFAGYGARTGAMWQTFLRFLGALPFDEQAAAEAIAAAGETFESLEHWLCDRPLRIAVEA